MGKTIINEMNRYRDIVNAKIKLQTELTDFMRIKFPNIKEVLFDHDSITITTQKHTIRHSCWVKPDCPTFVCDNPKMPDTLEEFLCMKEFLRDDFQQCYTAYYWLYFRYDIKG